MPYHKKYFIISAISAYAILLTLFFWPKASCDGGQLCIRFCCTYKDFCEKTAKPFLSSKNKLDAFRNVNGTDKQYNMKIGRPDCALVETEDYLNWTIDDFGIVTNQGLKYSDSEYCIRENSWKLTPCEKHRAARLTFAKASSIVSLVFLATTFLSYLFDKRLESIPRRCFLLFIVSLALLFIAPLLRLENDRSTAEWMSFLIGMILTFLWMNVLMYDAWWSFHRFGEAKESLIRFFVYCALVIVGTVAILPVFILDSEDITIILLSIVSLLAVMSATLICITGYNIHRLSKNEAVCETNRFQGENDRFWSYVQLLGIMLVIWSLESYNINQPYRLPEKAYLTGLLSMLSAGSILVIFVFHKSNYEDNYDELTKEIIDALKA